MQLILAEQLLLLFLDDEKGSDKATWGGDPGLAGAILLDLTAQQALTVDDDGKLVARTDAAPEHPLLAAAHAAIGGSDKLRDAKGWVGRLPKELKPLRERTAERLVEHGVLGEQRRKLLGIIPSTRFPQADPEPERELRERLRAILLTERQPTPQDAMLIALLIPYDHVGQLVPRDRRKDAKRRAQDVADGGAAAEAVDDALKGIQAAVIASTTAAIAATAATSGS
jgi:Golgi phosphoprotein 3 (GPP34)